MRAPWKVVGQHGRSLRAGSRAQRCCLQGRGRYRQDGIALQPVARCFGPKEGNTGLGHSLSSINDLSVEFSSMLCGPREGSSAWVRCGGYLSRKGLADTAFP